MRTMLLFGLLALVLGCGVAHEAARVGASPESDSIPPLTSTPADSVPGYLAREKSGASETSTAAADKKIIYEAAVSLLVKNFDDTPAAIESLVKSSGGYLAMTDIARNQGIERSGRWVARIPVDGYDSFLEALSKIGVKERMHQSGQDVTEEYVDLEARISTKKKLESRILELLENRDGEIKDVIVVEQELSRVRTDIEQMEGRLRVLENRVSLTTVTIEAREQQDYTPPEAPGLGGRIAAAWNGSVGGLGKLVTRAIVLGVGAIPWVLGMGIVAGPVWYLTRRR